jgi:hypothetical protein
MNATLQSFSVSIAHGLLSSKIGHPHSKGWLPFKSAAGFCEKPAPGSPSPHNPPGWASSRSKALRAITEKIYDWISGNADFVTITRFFARQMARPTHGNRGRQTA